jgi:murein DD-endopeptidase MepM/ murein hydrolase activator NlpD
MARIRYTYNPDTCKYEPIIVTPKAFGKSVFRFLGIAFLLGLAGSIYFHFQHPYIDETLQTEENILLKAEWQVLYKQLSRSSDQLTALEKNDDHNYRVILDLDPLSSTQREAGVGGREKESASIVYPLIKRAYEKAEKIKNRLDIETQSMQQLKEELIKKERKWASRPAIQPIDNRQLTRFNSIFGMRLHPVYHDWRNHNGLDLTAPHGTPVYASADGVVAYANWNGGYGNVIFINHGYGFETRYGHLSKYNSMVGQKVKRGDLIGFVGNTGVSTTDHLHFEVLYFDKFINPIHFMDREIDPTSYKKITKQLVDF